VNTNYPNKFGICGGYICYWEILQLDPPKLFTPWSKLRNTTHKLMYQYFLVTDYMTKCAFTLCITLPIYF